MQLKLDNAALRAQVNSLQYRYFGELDYKELEDESLDSGMKDDDRLKRMLRRGLWVGKVGDGLVLQEKDEVKLGNEDVDNEDAESQEVWSKNEGTEDKGTEDDETQESGDENQEDDHERVVRFKFNQFENEVVENKTVENEAVERGDIHMNLLSKESPLTDNEVESEAGGRKRKRRKQSSDPESDDV
jgi:hypothetical protein